MRRNVLQLAEGNYDVLVIGGGIYGACVAWDAALRGLSVALVDGSDFGSCTSANSLKTIHGGLRYLQDGDLALVRRMAQERRTWLRIAPHLVRPQPFIVPTGGGFKENKAILAMALKMNDWLTFDRNKGVDPDRFIPSGRIVSAGEYEKLVGRISPDGSGGALWHDAQMISSERLLLAVILAAVKAGAVVANHLRVTGFQVDNGRIASTLVEDQLAGARLQLRAKSIINCAGAWVDDVLELLPGTILRTNYPQSVALNLVTSRFVPQLAVGFYHKRYSLDERGQGGTHKQLLLAVPWHNHTMIGTWHRSLADGATGFHPTGELICELVDQVNDAWPALQLEYDDISLLHYGYLPALPGGAKGKNVRLLRKSRVWDHAQSGQISNMITLSGVKYTTARYTAEKAVDLAFRKLGYKPPKSQTDQTPVAGGDIPDLAALRRQAGRDKPPEIGPDSLDRILTCYGADYPRILERIREQPQWARTVAGDGVTVVAQIIHAIREEMAMTLADVLRRRTGIGAAGLPSELAIRSCADIMATELNWDVSRVSREIDELVAGYDSVKCLAA